MPEVRLDDTIAAVATPPGEGGIAVIRVSGTEALGVVGKVFRPVRGSLATFASHTVHLGKVVDKDGHIMDEVLVTVFRAPHSYTGQDVLEVSCHGGLVNTRRILEQLIASGARHAEPGEFTKRAFLNGKIDLAQAEAVLDLIRARSEASVRAAIRQLSGDLSRRLQELKGILMQMYAHMEAFLDFPEEDLEIYTDETFRNRYAAAGSVLRNLLETFRKGALLREGVTAVIVGKPNVGKSSLFNALLERDRALVSEIPGTTRDALEEMIEIDGISIRLIDTAGLREGSEDAVERLGMEKTRSRVKEADLFLFVTDGSGALEEADRLAAREIRDAGHSCPVIAVLHKADLPARMEMQAFAALTGAQTVFPVSSRTRAGFEALEKAIGAAVAQAALGGPGEQITRLRHKNALEEAARSLERSREAFCRRAPLEFVIEDLRLAIQALRELVGEVYSEDLLDVIFAEFCIGK